MLSPHSDKGSACLGPPRSCRALCPLSQATRHLQRGSAARCWGSLPRGKGASPPSGAPGPPGDRAPALTLLVAAATSLCPRVGRKIPPLYGFVLKCALVHELSAEPHLMPKECAKAESASPSWPCGLPVHMALARSFNLCDPLFPHLSSGERDMPLQGCSTKSFACPLPGAEQMLKMTGQ